VTNFSLLSYALTLINLTPPPSLGMQLSMQAFPEISRQRRLYSKRKAAYDFLFTFSNVTLQVVFRDT